MKNKREDFKRYIGDYGFFLILPSLFLCFFTWSYIAPKEEQVEEVLTPEMVQEEMDRRQEYWDAQVEVVFQKKTREIERDVIYIIKVKDCEYVYFSSRYANTDDILEHYEGCSNHE